MPSEPQPPQGLGILLLSGGHERAHYAFILATGAAALGRPVVVFATNDGCRALLADWSGMDPDARDSAVRATGVAGFATLREAAGELGVRMIMCEAGMRMAGLDTSLVAQGVEVAGVATFLEASRRAQLLSL